MAAVLYDFAPLFLPDLIDGAEQLRREADRTDVEWRLDEIETAAHEVNGRMVATVIVLAAHADVAGERLSFRADGECVAYDFGALGGADELCGDAGEEASARSGRDIPWPTDPVDSGVTVVERDGRWYVSVTPTLTYALRDVLATMEPDDVDAVVDGFRQAFEDMSLLLD